MSKTIKVMLNKSYCPTSVILSWIGILLPPAIYFYFVYYYSLNLPFADDFAQLNDVIRIIQHESLIEKFNQIFALHNEHRVAFTRIAYLLSYFTFGEINFRTLIIIGNIVFLVLLYLFFKISKVSYTSLLYFVPISILLFQLQSWKSMTWATSALSNQYILLFTGLTFYFLNKNTRLNFYSGCFFAIISAFTQGSGLVTVFLGWTILLFSKRYRQFFIWTAGACLLGFYYFQNFQTTTNVLTGAVSLSGVKNMLIYFFAYLGSSLSLNNIYAAVGFGVVLSFYLCFLTWDKYFKRNLTVYVFLVYTFLNAALVAVARSGIEVDNVFSPRYKVVSVVIIILVYITLAERFSPNANKFRGFVVIGILVSALSYFSTFHHGRVNLETRYKSLTWMANQWVNTNHGFFYSSGAPADVDVTPNSILINAVEGGFYKLPYEILGIPDRGYSSSVILPKTCEMEKRKVFKTKFSITPIGPESHPYLIRLEGIIHHPISNKTDNNATIHLILKSKNGSYTFETHPQHYLHGSVFFEKELSNVGFIALIPFEKIEKGLYRIGFCDGKSINFEGKVLLKN
jgi:hypothetical protein